MTCHRCHGLMVREQYDDSELGTAEHEILSWRCLNCGAIIDPVILAHRHTSDKTEPDQSQGQRLKKLVTVG